MGSKILFCGCNTGTASTFQDQLYSKGFRVHAITGKFPNISFSCTCCGKSKNSDVKKK